MVEMGVARPPPMWADLIMSATCDRDTDVYRAQVRTRATTKSTIFLGKSESGFIYLL